MQQAGTKGILGERNPKGHDGLAATAVLTFRMLQHEENELIKAAVTGTPPVAAGES
jgi:hypothetical protein